MYPTNEIFAKMPEAVATEIFTHLAEKEPALMKVTINTLCQQRKLRPIFVERKPRTERHIWLREALGRKQNGDTAAHLLQIWLVGKHSALLCDFLDALGIAHDDHGTIEALPSAPEKEKLSAAIDTILAKHDAGVVRVYLHTFQATDENGWPPLAELLQSDSRIAL